MSFHRTLAILPIPQSMKTADTVIDGYVRMQMYNGIDKFVLILDRPSKPVISTVKKRFALDSRGIKSITTKLRWTDDGNVGVVKRLDNSEPLSTIMNSIVTQHEQSTYLFLEPEVLIVPTAIDMLDKVGMVPGWDAVFVPSRYITAREAAKHNILEEDFANLVEIMDFGRNLGEFFYPTTEKGYSLDDYRVCICRRSFLQKNGGVPEGLDSGYIRALFNPSKSYEREVFFAHKIYMLSVKE